MVRVLADWIELFFLEKTSGLANSKGHQFINQPIIERKQIWALALILKWKKSFIHDR